MCLSPKCKLGTDSTEEEPESWLNLLPLTANQSWQMAVHL